VTVILVAFIFKKISNKLLVDSAQRFVDIDPDGDDPDAGLA
jgi:hypothetical protein